MKRKFFNLMLGVIFLPFVLGVGAQPGAIQPSALEDDIQLAIDNGLAWLLTQQAPDGGWSPSDCDRVAQTAMVVLKFNTFAVEQGVDPLDPNFEYADEIQAGLAFIMAQAIPIPISLQPAGNPDGNGDGLGVYWNANPCGDYHRTYNTAIALMALASSGHPEIYGLTAQNALDFLAWGQTDVGCALHQGGWRYSDNDCSSDNSNSGWVTLGLGYAAAPPPLGFGLTIPDWVKTELSPWLDVMQDDINGDPDDGGSWYDPYYPWVNILKTGNLIYEFGLVGDGPNTVRVQDAVDYIERHWNDPGGCDVGWRDHRQAMFTMMKGLTALGIDMLDLDGDGTPETDWYAEVAQHLVDTQQADGSWAWDCWGNPVMNTAWALMTLEKDVPVLEIPVSLDIKPGSCPNPFNMKEKGVLPVAIAGTADFDVTQIDPATIKLFWMDPALGVSPLRWAFEDVTTPFDPFLDKPVDAYACHTLGADGYLDLTLKFDSPAVAAMLAGVSDGDVIKLYITGNLKAEFGGTPIAGEDVVKIIKKK